MNKDGKNTIKLIKRSHDNNTHTNIVDDSIIEITGWKKDPLKFGKLVLYNILTLGVMYIISHIWKQIYISIACKPCEAKEADFLLIIDEDGKKHITESKYENFYKTNILIRDQITSNYSKKEILNSPYGGSELQNSRDETLVLYFRNNKYIFLESLNSFMPVIFELNRFKNSEIHRRLGGYKNTNEYEYSSQKNDNQTGMKNLNEYNYLLNKFGLNKIEMKHKSLFLICFEQLIHPFFLYQIFALVVWTADSYLYFSAVILTCSLIIITITSLQKFTNYKRILNFNHTAESYVKRNFELAESKENKDSFMIVPGDILEIGNEDVIPCDCLILDGFCTVNEADLTGESSLVLKTPLINDNREFNYEVNKKSFLFHGTKIIKCESNSENSQRRGIYAIAVSTGYNTNRGNLIQNILFPKPTNFKFYDDIKIFFLWMTVVWFLSIGALIYIHYTYQWAWSKTLRRVLDNITVIFPPSLPICMTFTSFFFHWNLTKKNISCIDEKRMNASGRTNIIVLDKTGTLTEESLEIHGFQTTKVLKIPNLTLDQYVIDFEKIEIDCKMMNKVVKKFWKKFCATPDTFINSNYLNNPTNNLIFFIETLATCHSIDKLKNEILGNTVDKKIFEKLNWGIEKLDQNYFKINQNENENLLIDIGLKNNKKNNNYNIYNREDNINYVMKPKNSFKITENLIFKNSTLNTGNPVFFNFIQNNLNNNENLTHVINQYSNKYYLIIIKRFEFSSKFQSMSVIIKNCLNNSYRFCIKGAPEKIAQICSKTSLPNNFEDMHMDHTKNGFRVLACATKVLPSREDYHLEEDRKNFENNLQFLGFIIFKNKLKRDTKHVISNLKNSNCKLVMATGDNPFTSLSVARECEMIETEGKFIYLIDLEKEYQEDSERLRISALFKDESKKNKKVEYVENVEKDDLSSNNSNIKKKSSRRNSKKKSILIKSILENTNLNINVSPNSDIKKDVNVTNLSYITNSDRKLINKDLLINENDTRKVKYEREFTKRLREIIKNNVILCVSGKAFDYILMKYKEEIDFNQNIQSLNNNYNFKTHPEKFPYAKLLQIVKEKGRIFFRMSPSDKVDLVNFFKEDKSCIVAMCGDGANDCGALLSADVGISVKQTKGNNVTSHFYSSEESISCIESILKNGRACYENSVIIFKYMIIYAMIQLTSAIAIYTLDQNFNTPQYFFVDCFLSLVSVLIASKTGPNYKLVKDNPPKSILNAHFFLGVMGQSVIQMTSILLYLTFFIKIRVDLESDKLVAEFDTPVASSYMFAFTSFQLIFVLFVFNFNSKHRKKFYANKTYLVYTALVLFITITFLTLNSTNMQTFIGGIIIHLEDSNVTNLQRTAEVNRAITLGWSVVNLIVTFLYECLCDYLFSKMKKPKY